MSAKGHRNRAREGTFLGSLRRDVRGNTLAMMTMALIPLAGMVGGGVDISRMYIVKTRLQHACDAGALAGRKAMSSGTWTQTVNGIANYPQKEATEFFNGNYNTAAYGATNVTKNFTENAGKVSGTASATVPMTLMRIFGRTSETLTVQCEAEMRLPNTDVMFVLDTTGSMDDIPSGDSETKMAALKSSVKCFYQIIARLDVTDTTCEAGEPTGGTGNQVQIRFGFVPYATNVNVGRLLDTSWIADTWDYQTRQATGNFEWGSWSKDSSQSCSSVPASDASAQYRTQGSGRKCYVEKRVPIPIWKYASLPVSISGLKNGSGWNASFTRPIGDGLTDKTITWDGCIEERKTVQASTYDPIPGGAKDLDIDALPTDADTRWGAALPGLIYTRRGSGNWDRNTVETSTSYGNNSAYYCPTPARKMQAWTDASAFGSYVNSLTPNGNTYHDIGLLWGARLLSPTGIFKAENQFTPKGAEIERHLIFMTDGDTNAPSTDYNAYGVPWFDQRQTTATTTSALNTQVNERFAGLCTAIKNKKITLWVISFGSVASSTVTRLTNCASTGRYFSASNKVELQKTFKQIADQISQLRLTG